METETRVVQISTDTTYPEITLIESTHIHKFLYDTLVQRPIPIESKEITLPSPQSFFKQGFSISDVIAVLQNRNVKRSVFQEYIDEYKQLESDNNLAEVQMVAIRINELMKLVDPLTFTDIMSSIEDHTVDLTTYINKPFL